MHPQYLTSLPAVLLAWFCVYTAVGAHQRWLLHHPTLSVSLLMRFFSQRLASHNQACTFCSPRLVFHEKCLCFWPALSNNVRLTCCFTYTPGARQNQAGPSRRRGIETNLCLLCAHFAAYSELHDNTDRLLLPDCPHQKIDDEWKQRLQQNPKRKYQFVLSPTLLQHPFARD